MSFLPMHNPTLNSTFLDGRLTFIDWSCFSPFLLSSIPLNCHLFLLPFFFLALFLLFCLLSCHYLISSLSSPSFFTPLCSWFSILFMKSCSPRVCLNCILEKKAPHNPGSSQSQLTKHYFHRLCLHDCVGLVVVDAVKYEACFFYLEYLFSLKLFSNF